MLHPPNAAEHTRQSDDQDFGSLPRRRVMTKYLLCRPDGGINDMLCQIGRCVRYCLKFDRVLVVDTANTTVFADVFSHYFTIQHPRLRQELDIDAFLDLAEARKLTLYPSSARLRYDIGPRLAPLKIEYWLYGYRWKFDVDHDYDADVLVHHWSGGGTPMLSQLKSLKVNWSDCGDSG